MSHPSSSPSMRSVPSGHGIWHWAETVEIRSHSSADRAKLSCRHVKLSRIVADSSAFAEVRHVEAGAMAGTSARNSSNDCNADVPALLNATSSCKLKRTRFSGGGATVPVHPLSSWRAVASPVRMPAVALDAAPVASKETPEAS